MKILQVFDYISRYGGGVASVVGNLSVGLAQKGHNVTIYTTDYLFDREYIDSLKNVNVVVFKHSFRLGSFLFAPGIIKEARRSLADFDIIHLHVYTNFLNIFICHYAKKYGIPYILDAHGNLPGNYRRFRKLAFQKLFGEKIFRNAGRFVAETQLGLQEYVNFGVSSDRIVKIFPGLDLDDFKRTQIKGLFREKYGIKQKNIILYLGRIHYIKGVDFLLDAFGQLAKHRNDIALVIAGQDDGYEAELKKKMTEMNLEQKVYFPGFVSQGDKKAAMADANVFVQPSRYEQGIALTTLEALFSDIPVIVTDGTGATEHVKEMDGGYVVGFGDKKDLCNKIQYILDNPDIAIEKTRRARTFAESHMSTSSGINEYEKLYRTCLQKN